MPFRLILDLDGTNRCVGLRAGEVVVGSSPDCDVRLAHPTVSRRHAALRVLDDRVEIRDLGSRNGTVVDDRHLHESARLEGGERVAFAGVAGRLQRVDAADVEPALELGLDETAPATRPMSADSPRSRGDTLSVLALQDFARQSFPSMVEAVARCGDAEVAALEICAALFATVPCVSLELRGSAEGEEGSLFVASRAERAAPVTRRFPTHLAAGRGDEVSLCVGFLDSRTADLYEPLSRGTALLLGLVPPSGAGRRASDGEGLRAKLPDPPSLDPAVQRIYAEATRVAGSDVSVLVFGESGTGKEVLARFLHASSTRAAKPFVELNCAALPADLLESELFGIERGVATGVDARPGKFEMAHGGTLFLDEIADMAPATQAKILRALQQKEVYRVGSGKARPADVRVLSATNQDLSSAVASGAFRRDLYHRIADWEVVLPPLRERRSDIPNLGSFFLLRSCRERSVRTAGISRAALDAMLSYAWPGNVRELEREMARVTLFLSDGGLVEASMLKPAIVTSHDGSRERSLKAVLERAERQQILSTLEAFGGDVAVAAKLLDVPRSTLYRRIKALGIRLER